MDKKNKIIATTLIYLVMVIAAIAEGLINIFTVPIKSEFNITDTNLSVMFMFGTLAYLIFNYVGGALCDRIGQKRIILVGLLGAIITNLIQAWSPNFIVFTISFALIQAFLALMSIATNTIIPVIWITGQAIAMNLTHFAYGVGLSASQKLSGILMVDGFSWRKIYIGSAILTLIVFIIFMFIKLPIYKQEKEDKLPITIILKDKLVWFFFVGLGFYILAEQGTGRWLPTFIESSYNNINESKIASYVSMFFLLLTIGRLIGGFIVEKIGSMTAVKSFSLIGSIIFIIGLFLGESGLYIISIAGFFFSIMFPTVVVIVSNTFKRSTAYITGIIIALASVVNMIVNLFLGVVSDLIGIKFAIFIVPISIFITFIFLCLASKTIKER
ncbi:sugar MFS transporter [Clostridium sp.]|uniref:MFS transporter n=1 Tax=Clostridium sp. TaxID=1506 RepID=UPI0026DDB422|nr:MFS transporter [Clostridium sp.]MDO5038232.1 MFS transporter [Clostridium sp.]